MRRADLQRIQHRQVTGKFAAQHKRELRNRVLEKVRVTVEYINARSCTVGLVACIRSGNAQALSMISESHGPYVDALGCRCHCGIEYGCINNFRATELVGLGGGTLLYVQHSNLQYFRFMNNYYAGRESRRSGEHVLAPSLWCRPPPVFVVVVTKSDSTLLGRVIPIRVY